MGLKKRTSENLNTMISKQQNRESMTFYAHKTLEGAPRLDFRGELRNVFCQSRKNKHFSSIMVKYSEAICRTTRLFFRDHAHDKKVS